MNWRKIWSGSVVSPARARQTEPKLFHQGIEALHHAPDVDTGAFRLIHRQAPDRFPLHVRAAQGGPLEFHALRQKRIAVC